VAVVQISRIQVRRGQKNQGTGLPQLASGELGWAVDSQELFIGNGAVSEGSPYVGNTKLLSEHDNLFEFANTYVYKKGLNVQTGVNTNAPVLRTLQARLDDRVSIRSFGGSGDGSDQTVTIQRAIDELYLNASNKGQSQARVVLHFEAGTYALTNSIYLPPYSTIQGAGADKTIFTSGDFPAFKTVNESSTPGTYAEDSTSTTQNQARNISLSEFTIQSTGGIGIALVSCASSNFTNLNLVGNYSIGDAVSGSSNGITLEALSTAVNTKENIFTNVNIEKFVTAVKSDNDVIDNKWINCELKTLWQGFAFGLDTILGVDGQLTGPINNLIQTCKFDTIYRSAIKIVAGKENTSSSNKFYRVGNEGGTDINITHPVIDFTTAYNRSIGDWFERTDVMANNRTPAFAADNTYPEWTTMQYVPEVKGPVITDLDYTHQLSIGQLNEFTKLFKLPAEGIRALEVDYLYKSAIIQAYRSGKMTIIVDPVNDTYNLSDDFDFTGTESEADNLSFDAEYTVDDGTATISIKAQNTTPSDIGEFHYKIKTKA
jgi:hypothetical protein